MPAQLLMTPGPTPLPPQVRKALGARPVHHRSEEFAAAFAELSSGLQQVFRTGNPVIVMSSTGSGAMEAAVANIMSPGDRALVISNGVFGDRWCYILKAFGVRFETLRFPDGAAFAPEQAASLISSGGFKAVFFTHLETSTGTLNPVREIAKSAARYGALTILDAVSSVAVEELETDRWGVDVVIASSAKGLMNPVGLSFASLSPRALAAMPAGASPRFYFDFRIYLDMLRKKQTPFSAPSGHVFAQLEAVRMILASGVESVWAATRKKALLSRKLASGLGLELFSQIPANGLTALKAPAGTDASEIVARMHAKFGIIIANGQLELRGKIFRIAHMGYIRAGDVRRAYKGLANVISQ